MTKTEGWRNCRWYREMNWRLWVMGWPTEKGFGEKPSDMQWGQWAVGRREQPLSCVVVSLSGYNVSDNGNVCIKGHDGEGRQFYHWLSDDERARFDDSMKRLCRKEKEQHEERD